MDQDQHAILTDINTELEPIKDFLQFHYIDGVLVCVSLKDQISYKEFSLFFPSISKKDLVKTLDYLNDNKKDVQFIIEGPKKDGVLLDE